MEVRVAIEPSGLDRAFQGDAAAAKQLRALLHQAIENAGGTVVSTNDASALAWLAIDEVTPLASILDANPQIRWVQLPWAGVETFADSGLLTRSVTYTCAKTAYAGQVSEHALTLILACLRNLVEQARTPRWHKTSPESLESKRVTILGAGGVTTGLMRFLTSANCDVTVLRRQDEEFPGARRTLRLSALHDVLPATDILVLALALTPETKGIIGARELALLASSAVLVNVARGAHVDTAALVDALKSGSLAAAGLDVTDPEPLPERHPLWSFDNVLITSHCADSVSYRIEKFTERVSENVNRFRNDKELLGVVDPVAGY